MANGPVVGAGSKPDVCQERQTTHGILVTVISPETLMLSPELYSLISRS